MFCDMLLERLVFTYFVIFIVKYTSVLVNIILSSFFRYISKIAAMLRRPGQRIYHDENRSGFCCREKAGVTKKDAGAVLDALIEEIIGAVKRAIECSSLGSAHSS